jgi:hypothetical protein
MFTFNSGFVAKEKSRASVRPILGGETFLKRTPSEEEDPRPRAMAESDLRSLLPTVANAGDSEPGVDAASTYTLAEFRQKQQAEMSNRPSTVVKSKGTGERLYKRKFRQAEEMAKAEREAATASLFGELPENSVGPGREEVAESAAERRGASGAGLVAAQRRRAFAGLAGSGAGPGREEVAESAAERRGAAKTGLERAHERARWTGLAGSNAGFSDDEREDVQARSRRDAVAGWQRVAAPKQAAPMGVPSIVGADEGDLGVGLRTAFRKEASPHGAISGGRKRGGFFSKMLEAFGLDRLFGSARTDAQKFDAVPRSARRAKPNGWFQRFFGTGRRPGR